jgi:hypothetical protein
LVTRISPSSSLARRYTLKWRNITRRYVRFRGYRLTKKKRKTQKKGRSYSNLKEHKQRGKELVPPLLDIQELELQSWMNDRLPEMLWAALLVTCLPRDQALSIVREVAGYADEHVERFRDTQDHIDVTLSGIARLGTADTEAIVGILTSQADRRRVLRPLALLEDLPARECWRNALNNPVAAEDWELLKVAVASTLDYSSREATDCQWARVLFMMLAGKLILPTEELAKEIFYYPDFGEMQKVLPTIRSTGGVLGAMARTTPSPPDFAPRFWSQCMRETACVAEPSPTDYEIAPASTTLQCVNEVYTRLVDQANTSRNTTALDARHDAVFGIGLYALSILKELLLIGAGNSISARLSLRTLLDCFVTLAYLVKRDSNQLWQSYRTFGAGQVKLAFIKLNESEEQVGYVKTESLERLANEDMWQEFVPINLGHWEKANLRAMSQQADAKDEYDRYYGWASAFSHGHWGAVRDTVLQTCQNPLHRLHRIPRTTPRALEDVVPDACRIVDQILAEVSKAYPRFDARVSL